MNTKTNSVYKISGEIDFKFRLFYDSIIVYQKYRSRF